MSGPLSTVDATPAESRAIVPEPEPPEPPTVEVTDGRETMVGAVHVRRTLPRRGRRTVGAWCFADHMGPEEVTETHGLDIGPHPHMGLHTVTWLLTGAVLHRDSLGSEQVIKPGQLNLMTAGNGVVHAEEATGTYRGPLQGVQLWVAQPETTRHGAGAFEHHPELPVVEMTEASAVVLVGELAGVRSAARADTPLVGAELTLKSGTTTWSLRADFEHAVVVLEGALAIGEHVVRPGQLGYVGLGREELPTTALEPTRALLLGGVPFPEPLVMWWNFVARTREEVAQARTQWATEDERFGPVSSRLQRIPAPPAL
jgi:redox-sensitive bicupin YhaK (pirin superfamily)